MTQTPLLVYRARDDATPEGELHALAACYRMILDSAKKGTATSPVSRPDDARKDRHAGT